MVIAGSAPSPVHSGSRCGHFLIEDAALELVVLKKINISSHTLHLHPPTPTHLEHLQQVLLLHLESDEGLFIFDYGLDKGLQLGEVIAGHLPILQVHVVVEPILNGGTIAEAAAIMSLHCLTKDVGTGVPEYLLAWGGIEGEGGKE